ATCFDSIFSFFYRFASVSRGGLMLNALRRAGALSLCCLSLIAGSAAAIETSSIQLHNPSYSHSDLASSLAAVAPDLNQQVLLSAVTARQCAVAGGAEPAERLAVIDFSLPSSEQRLWIFDLASRQLLLQDLVAHGQGSGGNLASKFSNIEGSHQSSI